MRLSAAERSTAKQRLDELQRQRDKLWFAFMAEPMGTAKSARLLDESFAVERHIARLTAELDGRRWLASVS